MSKGDWHCRNCGYLSVSRVTNAETCDACHQPVEWHDAEQQTALAVAQAEAREARAELSRMRLHYIGAIALLGRVATRLDAEDRDCVAAAMHDAAEHGVRMMPTGKGWSLEIGGTE